ncbi:bifunctional helix-turn-helix transcriptional regulator/GNAT family N-acetyltransferase [Marinomonas posidonica]|uniref:GCN5-related N-acetyltransferase n=1 Tax=Marinomonas posidonica (strain CECT 7376 / NCIMB 14433 / IVIA-Po-181) TaxID=491952 RepID=F6CRR5_MARPP|nr:bifunctional helix-turn-helix transcriptional regulator/GNAT family N-acetyltransferase [Marinomonas posidonica]AEF54918.1 GCN5-related N-acetyltransferase [Marinomonas posidonica IVIA-Po-181]
MEQFGVLTLGSRMKRLSDYLFAQVQEIYGYCEIPISSTYFPILRLLQVEGALSVTEMADRLHLSHPAISKQISKMLNEALLDKIQDQRDQRRTMLTLSSMGQQAMAKVEPVLLEMQQVLERMLSFSSDDFMTALVKLEQQVLTDSVANKVLDRLSDITIVQLESEQHQLAFHDLNMNWLERYFPGQINKHDYELLDSPKAWMSQYHGQIWLAVCERDGKESVLGCLAFKPHPDKVGEILKLAVADHCQGMGIAQRLLSHCHKIACAQGVKTLYLETANCLLAAKSLYEKNGFVAKPVPFTSLYKRADLYMEKALGGNP